MHVITMKQAIAKLQFHFRVVF